MKNRKKMARVEAEAIASAAQGGKETLNAEGARPKARLLFLRELHAENIVSGTVPDFRHIFPLQHVVEKFEGLRRMTSPNCFASIGVHLHVFAKRWCSVVPAWPVKQEMF